MKENHHPLISLSPETDLDHWIVDRIFANLESKIERCIDPEGIYAIAVGLEPCAAYLEGTYNTDEAWLAKQTELCGSSESPSKWSTRNWNTLEDSFFILGASENPEETKMIDNWIAEAESLSDREPYIDRFWSLTVSSILQLRERTFPKLIGRDIPVICQMSYYYDTAEEATRCANPGHQASGYIDDLESGFIY